ncbi:hypothetical protein ABE504_22545 [Paenibacillus oryzisoli]|uniref:hypothetical protein n=1 Tax=Paenibacillus oryzisoli TaxID=1850517 RepID=UPI003D2698D6
MGFKEYLRAEDRIVERLDTTSISFVKRVVVGNNDSEQVLDANAIEDQIALLNRCLNELPKGKIIGLEKGVHILKMGEREMEMQYVAYHVGFARKPVWLD